MPSCLAFLCGLGDWTQVLTVTRQALYGLSIQLASKHRTFSSLFARDTLEKCILNFNWAFHGILTTVGHFSLVQLHKRKSWRKMLKATLCISFVSWTFVVYQTLSAPSHWCLPILRSGLPSSPYMRQWTSKKIIYPVGVGAGKDPNTSYRVRWLT